MPISRATPSQRRAIIPSTPALVLIYLQMKMFVKPVLKITANARYMIVLEATEMLVVQNGPQSSSIERGERCHGTCRLAETSDTSVYKFDVYVT